MKRHGHSPANGPTATYRSWAAMKTRCTNPAAPKYSRYGGRGIKVCEAWLTFAGFLADMGEKPCGTTLERREVNGDYAPGNCVWATPKVQANNKTNNRRVTHDGETRTVSEWAAHSGIPFVALRMRLHRGWPFERAIATPLRTWK